MSMKPRCMNCDLTIHGVQCDSIVFGAPDGWLCKSCSQAELEAEAEAGTNDLPKLREWYKVKYKYPEPVDD